MIKIFKTTDSGVLQISEFEDNSWISMTNPTTEELFSVSSTYKIAPDDLRASLDEEERSRIEIEEYYSLILVDIPTIEERNGKDWYGTIPLAIIICDKSLREVTYEALRLYLSRSWTIFSSYCLACKAGRKELSCVRKTQSYRRKYLL